MDLTKKTRKFFIKFFILSLVLIVLRKILGLSEDLKPGLMILSIGTLILIILPAAGKPVYLLWKAYDKIMGESGIFLHLIALILFGTGLYRYHYLFNHVFCLSSDFSCGDAAHYMLAASLVFTAAFTPVKDPIFKTWMKLAHLIQSVVSRIILTLVFILTIIPLSLIARMVGKKFLVMKPDEQASTYWETPDPALFTKDRYSKHF
jgi:hypothetical protein